MKWPITLGWVRESWRSWGWGDATCYELPSLLAWVPPVVPLIKGDDAALPPANLKRPPYQGGLQGVVPRLPRRRHTTRLLRPHASQGAPSPMTLPLSVSGRSALDVAVVAARRAGTIILKGYSRAKQVSYKGRANPVTDTDIRAEETLLAILREQFPGHGILSEESGQAAEGPEYQWVVDPLDGTRNFAWGLPLFAVCVALARGEDVLLGVVYDPLRRELFCAAKGGGATLNGRPIHVSDRSTLESAIIATDAGYDDDKAKKALQLVADLWPGIQAPRFLGSAALGMSYVAAGRLDLYFHHSLKPWDLAAPYVIVEEAGGVITTREGKPASYRSGGVIVANPVLQKAFLERANGHPWQRA